MKISKSKKELARIISENGGWRDGAEWSIQDRDENIEFMTHRPEYMESIGAWYAHSPRIGAFKLDKLLPNWHQTILSRKEYFHLYPEQDAKAEFCESVTRSIPEPESKPTIEQLAADYRNRKDYADRKQDEADAAKADADESLRKLELAGEAIGLIVAPVRADKEPELVITDWRELRKGDEVEYVDGGQKNDVGRVGVVDRTEHDELAPIMNVRIIFDDGSSGWPTKWKFIRRP